GVIDPENARPERELVGRKVLVTRSAEGNSVEKAKLEKRGAEVVEFAAIEFFPPSSWDQCDLAIAMLDEINWIVFTSANGVRGFFERCHLKPETEIVLRKLKNRERLSPKFACVGPATKRMLEERGF